MESQSEDVLASARFLEEARRGDSQAWEDLIQRYRPYLCAVAARALNQPAGDCSSIVQDGLVKAFERIDQFRGATRAELLGWLARIVSNKAKDRNGARQFCPLPASSDNGHALAAVASTPSAAITRRERAARVLDAVNRLPEDYRNVVQQRVFQNLGYDEIAANLNRSNDAVRCLWVRALRRLRDELGEDL